MSSITPEDKQHSYAGLDGILGQNSSDYLHSLGIHRKDEQVGQVNDTLNDVAGF